MCFLLPRYGQLSIIYATRQSSACERVGTSIVSVLIVGLRSANIGPGIPQEFQSPRGILNSLTLGSPGAQYRSWACCREENCTRIGSVEVDKELVHDEEPRRQGRRQES